MSILHGWKPRLGKGLNLFRNTLNNQQLALVNTPTEVTLEGTPFSPEIMNELEQAIANSAILSFSAAPTASTPGALGQFGAHDGMIYYCTGADISMSYGAIEAGTYYFYAANLPYSFTLDTAKTGLTFDGATLTAGGSAVTTHEWPQGTKLDMTDASVYAWTKVTQVRDGLYIKDPKPILSGLVVTTYTDIQSVTGIAYGAGRYVACMDGGGVLVSGSANGPFEAVSTSASALNAVAYGNGTFLAVGDTGVISSDGTSWEAASGFPAGTWYGVVYFSGLWIISGSNGIYTSSDLTTWVRRYTRASYGLCATSSKVYAAGVTDGYYVMTSTNGTEWSAFSPAPEQGGRYIFADENGYVALLVGADAEEPATFYSGGGTGWGYGTFTAGSIMRCGCYISGTPVVGGYIGSKANIFQGIPTATSIDYAPTAKDLDKITACAFVNGHLLFGGSSGYIIAAPVAGEVVDGDGSALDLAANGFTADEFTVSKVDGSLWLKSGSDEAEKYYRLHADSSNQMYIHQYTGKETVDREVLHFGSGGVAHLKNGLILGGHSSVVGTTVGIGETTKSVPNATVTAMTSLTLGAGTWVVTGGIRFENTFVSGCHLAVNIESTSANGNFFAAKSVRDNHASATVVVRLTEVVSPTANTKYYLNCYHNCGAAKTVYYHMRAVRIA